VQGKKQLISSIMSQHSKQNRRWLLGLTASRLVKFYSLLFFESFWLKEQNTRHRVIYIRIC